jgi:hypothetical protein
MANMKVEAIEQEARAVSNGEHGSLVPRLLHTLPAAGAFVENKEIDRGMRMVGQGGI